MRRVALIVCGLALLGYVGNNLPGSSESKAATEPRAAAGPRASTHEARGAKQDGLDSRRSPGRHDAKPTESQDRRTQRVRNAGSVQDSAPRPRRGRLHPVLDVADGDTVTVAYRGGAVSVRLIGIDTPETVHPSEPVECGGPQASATATELLSGKRVRLVFDPSQGRLDAYGRTLAYVRAAGVGDVGLEMIRRGRAAEYTYDTSYAQQARYQAAERTAKAAGRGIWATCGGVDTPLRSASDPAPAARVPSQPGHGPRGGRSGAASGGATGRGCDPGYDPCVPQSVSDLDCADIDGPVRVLGDDPHGFDADGDGIGCDS